MKIHPLETFWKCYWKLPSHIQKKADRQIKMLAENPRHPSLHTKTIQGYEGIWEARIDLHHRMSFEMEGDTIYLRTAGNHDDVLNNP